MQTFPQMICRLCDTLNPLVYYGPAVTPGFNAIIGKLGDTVGTCVCSDCATARKWVTESGKIREGYAI